MLQQVNLQVKMSFMKKHFSPRIWKCRAWRDDDNDIYDEDEDDYDAEEPENKSECDDGDEEICDVYDDQNLSSEIEIENNII